MPYHRIRHEFSRVGTVEDAAPKCEPDGPVYGGMDRCWARWTLIAFGWVCVGVGFVGIFVPGLPTTVFHIIALWAFSKSSERFQRWLWNHSRFGPQTRAWHLHRVIPLKAKVMTVVMMAASLAFVAIVAADGWLWPVLLALLLTPVCIYLLSRDSTVPGLKPDGSLSRLIRIVFSGPLPMIVHREKVPRLPARCTFSRTIEAKSVLEAARRTDLTYFPSDPRIHSGSGGS